MLNLPTGCFFYSTLKSKTAFQDGRTVLFYAAIGGRPVSLEFLGWEHPLAVFDDFYVKVVHKEFSTLS